MRNLLMIKIEKHLKEKLRRVSEKTGLSMTQLIKDELREMMKDCGIDTL